MMLRLNLFCMAVIVSSSLHPGGYTDDSGGFLEETSENNRAGEMGDALTDHPGGDSGSLVLSAWLLNDRSRTEKSSDERRRDPGEDQPPQSSCCFELRASRPSGRYTNDEVVNLWIHVEKPLVPGEQCPALKRDSRVEITINGHHAVTVTMTEGMPASEISMGILPIGDYFVYGVLHAHLHEEGPATVGWNEMWVVVEEKVRVGPLPGRVQGTFLDECLRRSASQSFDKERERLIKKVMASGEMKRRGVSAFAGRNGVNPCWWALQKQTFARPVFLTKQELALMYPHQVCQHQNTQQLWHNFPSRTDVIGPQARMGTCAVVGNAGHLRGSGFGEEIDSHDTILRINMAPTRGFEHDVGSRSVCSLLSTERLLWLSLDPQLHQLSRISLHTLISP